VHRNRVQNGIPRANRKRVDASSVLDNRLVGEPTFVRYFVYFGVIRRRINVGVRNGVRHVPRRLFHEMVMSYEGIFNRCQYEPKERQETQTKRIQERFKKEFAFK